MRIDKDLKRYYWSKYNYLKTHNGAKFAAETFKSLRQVILRYIDDPDRVAKREDYIQACPVRKNGWLRRLFVYADVSPVVVLQFLKLYTVEDKPLVTVEEASTRMHETLAKAEKAPDMGVLDMWLYSLRHKPQIKQLICDIFFGRDTDQYRQDIVMLFTDRIEALKGQGVDLNTILSQELGYIDKMNRILTPRQMSDKQSYDRIQYSLPTLLSYAVFRKLMRDRKPIPTDFGETGIMEGIEYNPFEEDFMVFVSNIERWPELQIIADVLPDGLVDLMGEVNGSTEEDPLYAGYIRHIPKPGTVDRRAIADPNKFFQAGTRPWQKFLRSMTSKIPHNCQFQQWKLDSLIAKELHRGYAGSVDLHQATDWLPFSWFRQIEDAFREEWYPTKSDIICKGAPQYQNRVLKDSRNLSVRLAKADWQNEYYLDSWKRGQPLGTAPSFEILTITHFGVVESISWLIRDLSSPYALLGDDIVLFNEKVRSLYIEIMEDWGTPLSHHKSYSGRLTEFAGKVFVRNQDHQFCSSIPVIGWSNLFDFQLGTGMVISYRDLPKEVKNRLCKAVDETDPQHALRPEDLYKAMQIVAFANYRALPSRVVVSDTQVTDVISELVANYYLYEKDPRQLVVDERLYGFVCLGVVGAYDHLVKLPRTHSRKKAKWWKNKVRPEATTSIMNRCLHRYDQVERPEDLG
jgi:hypothetical protein